MSGRRKSFLAVTLAFVMVASIVAVGPVAALPQAAGDAAVGGPSSAQSTPADSTAASNDASEQDGWTVVHEQPTREGSVLDITRVSARSDTDTLHVRVEHAGNMDDYGGTVLGLDTDQSAGTGLDGSLDQTLSGSGLGVDYSVIAWDEPTSLAVSYPADPDNASDSDFALEVVEYRELSGETMTIGLNKSALGSPGAIDFTVLSGFADGNAELDTADTAPRRTSNGSFAGGLTFPPDGQADDEQDGGPFNVTGGTVAPGGELTINVSYRGQAAVDEAALAVDTPPIGENGWFAGTLQVVDREAVGSAGFNFGENVSFVVVDADEGDYAEGSFVLEVPENADPGSYTYSPAVEVDGESAPGPESTITVGDDSTAQPDDGNQSDGDDDGDQSDGDAEESDDGDDDGDDQSDGEADDSDDPAEDVPTARIDQTTRGVTPGEQVAFTAEGSTGDIDSYEWTFEGGARATSAEVAHSFAEPGSYEVTLTVSGPNGTDTATTEVRVSEEIDFVVEPESPSTADTITFEAVGEADQYTWGFDSGDVGFATGERVTHSYDEAGEYDVSLTAVGPSGTRTVNRTVAVEQASLEFYQINETYESAPLVKGLFTEKDLLIALRASGTSVEEVYVEYDDHRVTAECRDPRDRDPADQRCDVPLRIDEFDFEAGLNPLTVAAIGEDGEAIATTYHLEVLSERVPATANLTVDEPGFEARAQIDNFPSYNTKLNLSHTPVLNQLPLVIGAELGAGLEGQLTWVYNLRFGTLEPEIDLALGGNLLGKGAEVRFQVDTRAGPIDNFQPGDFGVSRVRLAGIANAPLPAVPVPKVRIKAKQIGGVDVETSFSPRLVVEYGQITDLTPHSGRLDVWINGEASADLEVRGWTVTPSLGLELYRAHDLADDPSPLIPRFEGTGYSASLNGSVTLSRGLSPVAIKIPVDDLVANPGIQGGTNRDEPDWAFFNIEESGVEILSAPVRAAATQGDPLAREAITTPTAPAGPQRVTDGTAPGASPQLAAFGDEHLLAWETVTDREGETGNALAVATGGESWSEPTYLTAPDERAHVNPAVATNGEQAVVAWEVVDTDTREIDELADYEEHLEIAYAHYDGESWSEPTVLTDSAQPDTVPTVTAVGDGFAVAWQRADSLSLSDAETAVRYVGVGPDGAAGRQRTIDDHRSPVAADGSLVSYDAADGELRRDGLTRDDEWVSRSDPDVYETDPPNDVAVSGDTVAWTASADTSQVSVAENGLVDRLPTTSLSTVDSLSLVESPAGTVLTYRADRDDPDAARLAYSIDHGDGWSRPRTLAQTEGTPLSTPASAPTDEGTLIAVAGAESTDATPDIFTFEHLSRPDYNVTASVVDGDGAPGESVTVEYTVTNVGDVAGPSLPVVLRTDTDEVETTLDAVPAGDTATGTATVEVGATGTIDVIAGEGVPQYSRTNNRTRVRASTPALRVAETVVTGQSAETVTVAVTVANGGPVRATALPVRIQAGGESLGETTVDSVPAGETVTARLTLDRDAAATPEIKQVVLDPDDTVAGVETASYKMWLLQPDLTVHDETRYEETAEGVAARVLVSNAGTVDANATVTVTNEDGAELGRTRVTIPAESNRTVFQEVSVPLADSVTEGSQLTIAARSTVPDRSPGSTVISDTFGPVFSADPPRSESDATDAADTNETGNGPSETGDDGGPGFGIVTALVAVLFAVLLGHRSRPGDAD